MSKSRILIISSCGKGKSVSQPDQPTCSDLNSKEKRESQKKKFSTNLKPAGELYTGQQARSIFNAVSILKKRHFVDYFIISAGFGFVSEEELLPPYECSFSNLKVSQIKEMSRNLNISEEIKKNVQKDYDLIYLALGKDYFTALDDLSTLISKSSLIVHFNKKLISLRNSFYIDDYYIVNTATKTTKKIFIKPIGALIASKGTILENYALFLQEKDSAIQQSPINEWLNERIDYLKSNIVSEEFINT
jgi:hypothetical protein